MTRLNTPVSIPATEVYIPSASGTGTPHAVIFNNGSSGVYLGSSGNVTAANGLLLPPNAEINFPIAPLGIWAIASSATYGSPVSSLAAAVTAGGTVLTLTGTATTGLVPGTGQTFAIGTGSAIEYITTATYNAGAANGTVTTTTPFLYDHATAATAQTILTVGGGNLSVVGGST
jgi:hypothetical protein